MDLILKWLGHYEPIWLLVVLVAELWYSIRIHTMARIEFEYDKEWNEKKAARRKKVKGMESASLSYSGSKEDLAVGPSTQVSPTESPGFQRHVGLREVPKDGNQG